MKLFENYFLALISHVEFNEHIVYLLKSRVLQYSMKVLDAIHLASALWIKENIDTDCKFLCSDKELLEIAGKEGPGIIKPEESP